MPEQPKWKRQLSDLRRYVGQDIWQVNTSDEIHDSWTKRWLRFIILSSHGAIQNKLPSQSAALSYYTLIAIGPLLALAIMVSGFVLQDKDDDFAVDALNRLILFVAPQVSLELSEFPPVEAHEDASESAASLNPQLIELINNLVDKARSGAVGIVGSIVLIFISIQLISSIENTFNQIWGVRRGRTLSHRVVTYWTLISLGAVLAFAAVTIFAGSTIAHMLNRFPLEVGRSIEQMLKLAAPLFSFTVIALLLALFYRFIPNTTVKWMPALAGAVLVTGLLLLNNYLSFLYIDRVIRAQSLYGSIAIIPILLFGLFIFWLFVLAGGQLSYCLQNFNLLTNSRMWENISLDTRETLSLVVMILVARRFQSCQQPLCVTEMSEQLHIPSNVINQCITFLCDMGYLAPTETPSGKADTIIRFLPGKPLEKISLATFKQRYEEYGNRAGADALETADPIVHHYRETLTRYCSLSRDNRSLAQLIESFPVEMAADEAIDAASAS